MMHMLERPHHDIEDYPRAKEEFKELYEFEGSAYMFDRYSKAIDNHAFRSEYAMNLDFCQDNN